MGIQVGLTINWWKLISELNCWFDILSFGAKVSAPPKQRKWRLCDSFDDKILMDLIRPSSLSLTHTRTLSLSLCVIEQSVSLPSLVFAPPAVSLNESNAGKLSCFHLKWKLIRGGAAAEWSKALL